MEVLRTMQKAYFGKVKMIYIDPPYNTGNDSFVYPDDYSETLKEYQARTGQTDEAGFVNKQTLWKKNTKENGQFHSVWLSMMYPRLFLARNLLRDDGVIFVSIDDNEAADLKLLMDEIFGEENFVANVLWQKKYAVSNDDPGIAPMHDHIFVYRKSEKFERNLLPRNEKQLARYKNPDEDARGEWSSGEYVSSKTRTERPTLWYPIIHPKTGREVWPDESAVWRYSYEQHQKMVDENRLYWGPDQSYEKPRLKRFLSEIQDGVVPSTWWTFDMVGHNDEGQKETADLIGRKIFSTPKPVRLIRHILAIAGNKDALVFDFFGGSGTTAQAVLELNEEDGGNRQFICVQMPEVVEDNSEAYKTGYRTIADIGRSRIKKVIERIETKRHEASKQKEIEEGEEAPRQSLGFNAFKLAPSNFKEWRTDVDQVNDLLAQLDYHIDSTKPDSEAGSMVYELLLKLALPITTPIESHKVGHDTTAATVYMAKPDSGKHVAMFFEALYDNVLTFILKAQPVKVLCLNKCFVDSQALTNFSLQLQDADIALEVL